MLPGHFCTSLPHTHVNPQVGLRTCFRCVHGCFLGGLSHLWTSEHVLMPTGRKGSLRVGSQRTALGTVLQLLFCYSHTQAGERVAGG